MKLVTKTLDKLEFVCYNSSIAETKENEMRITREIRDEKELLETLKALSIEHGGAWVFSIKPFGHETAFIRFASPSKVPDSFHDLTSNKMGHKGKIRSFTTAARRREQNRGLGRN